MLIELFLIFLKLGAFTIGGGVAMMPILREAMVNDKKWFSEEEMIDILSICQSLPGVIAVNMATYVGFKKKGLLGSLVATTGVILPSFVMIIILAKGIAAIGGNSYLLGALAGLRAAAAGLVIVAVWQMGRRVIKDWLTGLLALASFVLILFFDVSVAYVVLLYLVGGVLKAYLNMRRIRGGGESDAD